MMINPSTANTLGIICSISICTLAVTVMIQPEPVKPTHHATREVILLPMIHPVIKSSPVDKTKLFTPKNEKERLKMVAEIWHLKGHLNETKIFADRGR